MNREIRVGDIVVLTSDDKDFYGEIGEIIGINNDGYTIKLGHSTIHRETALYGFSSQEFDHLGTLAEDHLEHAKEINMKIPRYEIQSFDYADPKGRTGFSVYDRKERWHIFPIGVEWVDTKNKSHVPERVKKICEALNLLEDSKNET